MAQLNYNDLIAALKDQPQYVRVGNAFQLIKFEGVSMINGQLSITNVLGEKITADGNKVTRKARTPKGDKPESKTAKR